MKIGLLTFSRENNYGANLQCYALTNILSSWGHEVTIINLPLQGRKFSVYSIVDEQLIFGQFRKKYLPTAFTRAYYSEKDLTNDPPVADLYIVGSDQVWNPNITKDTNPHVYFFSWLPETAKRISYAASFGVHKWNFPDTEEYIELLKKFSHISVREQIGLSICHETFGLYATEVLDPTFLPVSYDNLCGKYDEHRQTNELVCFRLYSKKNFEKAALNFANEKHWKAVSVYTHRYIKGFVYVPFPSVADWLNRIRYARFVITGSFHCVVFCILFKKQFICISNDTTGRNERKLNLLAKFGLEDRHYNEQKPFEVYIKEMQQKEIDYHAIDEKLCLLREESLSFLRNAIDSLQLT
jgi:hypothetical protein